MSKNLPLKLPTDPKDAGPVLTRWSTDLERRLLDIENKHAISHQQLQLLQAEFDAYKLTHP